VLVKYALATLKPCAQDTNLTLAIIFARSVMGALELNNLFGVFGFGRSHNGIDGN
jgi:hypothetical protein